MARTKDIDKKKKDVITPDFINPQIVRASLESARFDGKQVQSSKKEEPKTKKQGSDIKITQPAVVRSGDTGAVTGLVMPNGKQFGNLPAGHAQALIQGFNRQQAELAGSVEMSDLQAQQAFRDQLAQQQALLDQQTQTGQTAQEGMFGLDPSLVGVSPVDMQQAFTNALLEGGISSIGGYLGGAVLSAGTGARTGTVLGPKGAVIGAVAGLAYGLFNGMRRNIQQQRRDTVDAKLRYLTEGKQTLADINRLIELDPANAAQYIGFRNEVLSEINQAHQELKIDTQSDLNRALGETGTRALAEFDAFYMPGGENEILRTEAELALINPNPEKAMASLLITRQGLRQDDRE